ncbi:type II secretion system minor pseudopilin GspK [Thalassovita sp.]|jgi:general secretion pathway protein K|uniref:type II secretion system minor pseudopilin GspK n=1 Tax=Thalassovita sp. TaxID=1979401 RepID=UPI003B592B32
MRRTRGFVLLNALVLIAALASVAALLLTTAGAGRERLSQARTAAQLDLNLDAFEAFATQTLTRSADGRPQTRQQVDALYDIPLERGRVSGQIQDLQGQFNLNWLTDPSFSSAHQALSRLMRALGVSERDEQLLRNLVDPRGPKNKAAYLALDPPEYPVGGALLMVQQLDRTPGLSDRGRERLKSVLTALPGDSTLNVNTADPLVLSAFLPDLSPAALDTLLVARRQSPFASVQDFMGMAGLPVGEGEEPDPGALQPENLSIRSQWFEARITATLNGHHAQRRSVLRRKGVPAVTTTQWRVTQRP